MSVIISPSVSTIRDALDILLDLGSAAELRILETPKRTVSGYFNDWDKLAEAAASWSGNAPAVYVTLNPVNPALLARSANRLTPYAKHTTADYDILRRRWLPIDLDPVRPAGVSSTDDEHRAARERAKECRAWLRSQGWPEPVVADSGNGYHLLYPVDLPNNDASLKAVNQCLQALAFKFNDDTVTVDLKTGNAARIWKVYGTKACKGDDLPERPHRIARIVRVPEW